MTATGKKDSRETPTASAFAILDAVPHPLLVVRRGVIVHVSPAVQRILGWFPEDLVGRSPRMLLYSEKNWPKLQRHMATARRTLGSSIPTFDMACRRADGESVLCQIALGANAPDTVLLTLEDVTALRQAEAFFRSIASNSQTGVYVILNGVFSFVNSHAARYTGYREAELIGRDSMSLVHPEDREKVRRNTRRILAGATQPAPLEFRIITKQGKVRWIMETVTSIPLQGKDALLVNSMDVTTQIESRKKLEELAALEASILDAIPSAVIGLHDRTIVFANDGLEKVFGWKANELIGQCTRIFYKSTRDFEEVAQNLYERLETSRTASLEFPCRRKDSREILCRINAARIGECLVERHIVVIFEDITGQQQAKEQLEQSRQQLRSLTAHLHSVRDKEQSRIARELHDELGQLLTALNTDIILLRKRLPEELTALTERTDSMTGLVSMTLQTLKRIYTALRPEMLDHLGLTAALGWQVEEFRKRTGIPCHLKVPSEDAELSPDLSTTLYRICQEALTNISRHAQASSVFIDLKHRNGSIWLTVRDDGIGVTPAEQTKANSFGLMGIRERAAFWGGTVTITGSKGQGTTVQARIPIPPTGGKTS